MRARHGFTVMELLVVVILLGVTAGVVLPRVGSAMTQNRLQRATSVVSTDLRLAHSMAARRAAPVRVDVDTAQRFIRVRNVAGTDTVFSMRRLSESEFRIQRVTTTRQTITVYPSGIASHPVEITLRAGGTTRKVSMTRAGQVRILQ